MSAPTGDFLESNKTISTVMNCDDLCFTFADSLMSILPPVKDSSFDLPSYDLTSQTESLTNKQQYSKDTMKLSKVIMALQSQLISAMSTNAGLLQELKRLSEETNCRLLSMQALHERKLQRQQDTALMLSRRLEEKEQMLEESTELVQQLRQDNTRLKALQQAHAREIENYAGLLKKAKDELAQGEYVERDREEWEEGGVGDVCDSQSEFGEMSVVNEVSLTLKEHGQSDSFGTELKKLIAKIK
jgi:myosin heavy subunit